MCCKRYLYFQNIMVTQNFSMHQCRYMETSGFLSIRNPSILIYMQLKFIVFVSKIFFYVLNRANSYQHAATHRQHPPARSLSSYRDPLPQHSHLIRDSCQPTVKHLIQKPLYCINCYKTSYKNNKRVLCYHNCVSFFKTRNVQLILGCEIKLSVMKFILSIL